MAGPKQDPLDEMIFHRPLVIGWWMGEMHGKYMDENFIHRYLSEMPFFDPTTKNGLTFTQAQTNMHAYNMVHDRKSFEEQLARQRGTEYVIVGDPQEVKGGEPGQRTGVFVVRKQNRDKNRGMPDELETLGTYYLVNENFYQAPSVGDVVGNRLVSAVTNLSEFYDTAKSLPAFSPTAGYSYLPPATGKPTLASAAAAQSTSATPSRSREGSAIPGTDTQSLRSGSVAPSQTTTAANASANPKATRLLEQSLHLALQFGGEFTDENPMQGEPGHFSFAHTAAAIKKRKADEEAAAAAKLKKEQERAAATASRATSPKAEVVSQPPAVMSAVQQSKVEKGDRRGSRVEKARRKKSRAVNSRHASIAGSPTTPKSALSMSEAG